MTVENVVPLRGREGELPSLRLIRFLKTLETSLGHCFGRLRLS